MMKKKEEIKHLRKRWNKMQHHFKRFTHTQEPEQLHAFRVQVKKIRSFLTLLETDKKNEPLLKIFKPVKKIFKSAGVIRDAFLHQKQATENGITQTRFYQEQDALQNGETQRMVNKSKKHLHKMKLVEKKLLKHLHPLSPEKIKTFFKNQLHNTHWLLNQHNFSEQLHDGRKMLKHLMYNKPVLQDELAKELSLNFNYISEMQELLGQWHDNKLALAFLDTENGHQDLRPMKEKNEKLEAAITAKASDFEKKITAGNHQGLQKT